MFGVDLYFFTFIGISLILMYFIFLFIPEFNVNATKYAISAF